MLWQTQVHSVNDCEENACKTSFVCFAKLWMLHKLSLYNYGTYKYLVHHSLHTVGPCLFCRRQFSHVYIRCLNEKHANSIPALYSWRALAVFEPKYPAVPCNYETITGHYRWRNFLTAVSLIMTSGLGIRRRERGSSLAHWGQDKMATIFQTTFSNGSSCMNMY